MNQVVTVSGITFVNKDPVFKELRPQGFVMLKPDPENKYDKNAVEVWYDDETHGAIRLGFLPKQNGGDILQKQVVNSIANNEPVFAGIVKYAYHEKEEGWNENHHGKLQAVQLFVGENCDFVMEQCASLQNRHKAAQKPAEDASDENVTSTHYEKGKKQYRRLTDLLGCYEPDGKEAFDRLIQWAMTQGMLQVDESKVNVVAFDTTGLSKEVFKGYKTRLDKTASDGTNMHNAIELWLKGDKEQPVPQGFLNFYEKYKPEVLGLEKTVYDDEILVAGTYDAKFKVNIKGTDIIIAADWKSSKAVRKKHKTQVGTYGHWEDTDEAWVIAFGATNKQGYSLNRQTREQCAVQYEKVKLIKQLQDLEG